MVDDLRARARSARRHLDAYERDMVEIERMLPLVRVEKKLGPRALEEMILGLYDRGTISRKTAEAAGTSKKASAPSAA